MKTLTLAVCLLLAITTNIIAEENTALSVPRVALEKIARNCLAEQMDNVLSWNLTLRTIGYSYEVSPSEGMTNEYYGLTFVDPHSISESITDDQVTKNITTATVLLTISGIVGMSINSEVSHYLRNGKLIDTLSKNIHGLPPAYNAQHGTTLHEMSTQLGKERVALRVAETVVASGEATDIKYLLFTKAYFEWNFMCSESETNDIFRVEFIVTEPTLLNDIASNPKEHEKRRHIRVAIDKHGNVLKIIKR